jgi:lipopolysaccharide export system protein LptC
VSDVARRLDEETRTDRSPPAGRRLSGYGGQRPVRLAGRTYTRFVSVMKWVLPALALSMAGLVVAWPELQEAPIPTRSAAPDEEMEAGQMASPRFAGLDSENRPYSVTGSSAYPHPEREGIMVIERPEAEITVESGAWLALIAERGLLDNEDGHIRLEGEVNLFRDDGYTFATDEVEIDLHGRSARGDEPVSAHGPSGEIAASGFRIVEGGRSVSFTGPTRMVMRGAQAGESGP